MAHGEAKDDDAVQSVADAGPNAIEGAAADERNGRLRTRSRQIVLFAIVVGAAGMFLAPKIPHTQHLRLHLGVGSSRVIGVTARVGVAGLWEREVRFHYEHGAPPVIDWTFEHTDGDVEVEVELESPSATATDHLPATLNSSHSDETRLDVSATMLRLP